jgi:hypothetical protein
MIFRRRQSFPLGVGVQRAVGLSVLLSPDDFLSALPPAFRDEHNASHTQAQEALRLAHAAEQRVSWMEEKLETEGTESARLKALEAELERVKTEMGQRTGKPI